MNSKNFSGDTRKRLVKEVRSKIAELGLETAFDTGKRHQKTNAACMLLGAMRALVEVYSVR
jgi:hypothetical protein